MIWRLRDGNVGRDGNTKAAKNLLEKTNFYQTTVSFERMMILIG